MWVFTTINEKRLVCFIIIDKRGVKLIEKYFNDFSSYELVSWIIKVFTSFVTF